MTRKSLKLAFIAVCSFLLVFSSASFLPKKAKAYTSNTNLDNRVIFQSFSLYQPYESNMYDELSKKGSLLKEWGITDVWLPPAYRSFNMGRYMEGYAIADRYDLGEFNQGPNNTKATKYGTSDELKSMINTLHQQGLKVQEDLVPNQMLGLSGREAVYVTRTDNNGNLFKNPYTTGITTRIRGDLYLAYTKGGGQGQAKYGYIKEWNKKYFNGTSLQGQGIGRVMTDDNGVPYRYFGPNSKNYLPEWLNEAAAVNKINTVDGYLSVDGWYAAKDAATTDQYWKPMLINYAKDKDYLPYMSKNGFATVEEIVNGDNGKIADLTNAYLQSNPKYGYGTEEKTYKNDNSGIDDQDQFLFVKKNGGTLHNINNTISGNNEFLVGMDIDNSNPTVQKEQIHWMNWLLDTYKFDGFRVDAASHYDKQVLLDLADVMKEHFGSNEENHLSYIESYSSAANDFENKNSNPQLSMDYALYYTFQNALAKGTNKQKLSTLATNSVVDRNGSGSSNATPNWSFVTNHDQEKNRINNVMLNLYGIKTGEKYTNTTPKSFENLYDKDTEKKALAIYQDDMNRVDKKYAPHNVVSQYAYLLTNKNTVPTVYYGDMYQTGGSYMSKKTPYYDAITKLLKVRKDYAYGNQKVTNYTSNTSPKTAGQDLISSVRYGKDRNTGVATVIGNNPKLDTTIKVNMGSSHKNQVFKDATGFHSEKLVTDSKGVLTIHVKGTANAQVKGYLSVWIPTKDKVPTLTWNSIKSVYQGKTAKVSVKLTNSSSKIKSTSYASSNKAIATVDKNGNVKGNKKTGKVTINTTITTKDNFVLYSSKQIEVKANQVTLKANSAKIKKGKTTTISVKSSTDKIKTASYKSSNTKIATVSKAGKVTGKKAGKTTITATYKTQGGYIVTKKFTVTVK